MKVPPPSLRDPSLSTVFVSEVLFSTDWSSLTVIAGAYNVVGIGRRLENISFARMMFNHIKAISNGKKITKKTME